MKTGTEAKRLPVGFLLYADSAKDAARRGKFNQGNTR